MELVDLRKYRPFGSYFRMGCLEVKCIVVTICNFVNVDIDLIGLLQIMVNLELISPSRFNQMCLKYGNLSTRSTRHGGLNNFIMELSSFLSFESFCFLLKIQNYKNVVKVLRLQRFNLIYKQPTQIKIPYSKETHSFYRTLKSCVDNDSFQLDKVTQLQKIIDKQNETIMHTERFKPQERQFALEKKVAATVLQLQMYPKDYDRRKQILEGALRSETNGLDNSSLQIIYHSKMAVTEAQNGNYAAAEEHLVQTKTLCARYQPCFAVTSALHDIEYTSKIFYFANQTEENLEKVLTDGDLAIQSLQDTEESVRNLWQRIMLLFMVMSLLLITPEFVVVKMRKTKTIQKELAKSILKDINKRSTNMEYRRKMIVRFCQAVLNEEDNIEVAETYAKQSLKAAEAGGCFREVEKKNIKYYLLRLQRKQFNQENLGLFCWLCLFLVLLLSPCLPCYVYL